MKEILRNNKNYIFASFAILFYLVHGIYWYSNGVLSNMLWACHLASLIVGIGLFLKNKLLITAATLLLIMGNIFWALFLWGGGKMELTSPLTHLGGLICGLYGCYVYGVQVHAWIFTVVFLACLQIISRFITPEIENINLAFAVAEGWDKLFPDYLVYEIFLLIQSSVTFFISERILSFLRKKIVREI